MRGNANNLRIPLCELNTSMFYRWFHKFYASIDYFRNYQNKSKGAQKNGQETRCHSIWSAVDKKQPPSNEDKSLWWFQPVSDRDLAKSSKSFSPMDTIAPKPHFRSILSFPKRAEEEDQNLVIFLSQNRTGRAHASESNVDSVPQCHDEFNALVAAVLSVSWPSMQPEWPSCHSSILLGSKYRMTITQNSTAKHFLFDDFEAILWYSRSMVEQTTRDECVVYESIRGCREERVPIVFPSSMELN